MLGPGTVLDGRYRLEHPLARGGFATVYLATHLRLGNTVAIKVLDSALFTDDEKREFLERFAQEAALVARLDHPNILGVFDYGEYGEAEGTAYLVMPYADGGTLHDLLRREGRLVPARAVNLLTQAATALDYAHARGIVHRDVKPQNMLLRAGEEHLLLADFGIAKLLRETSALSQTRVTGTLAYMAPEQFQGRTSRAGDVYALGCVAFQLLTGQVPYPGTSEQVMFGHTWGPIPHLAERGGAHLPPAAQEAIQRALAKRPEDRFASAGALSQALAQALAQPTAVAAAPTAAVITVVAQPGDRDTGEPQFMATVRADPRTAGTGERQRSWQSIALLTVGVIAALIILVGGAALVARSQSAASATTTPATSGGATATITVAAPAPAPRSGTATAVAVIGGAGGLATATPTIAPTPAQPGGTATAVAAATAAQTAASATVRAAATGTVQAAATFTAITQGQQAAATTTVAQARAQARATADTWAAGSRIVFGPASGDLAHDPNDNLLEIQSARVNLRDFIVEAKFTNPYEAGRWPWSHGIGFRDTGINQEYRLAIRSDKEWNVRLYTGDSQASQLIAFGRLPDLNTSENDQNSLTLFVRGDTALFFLNGTSIATFSIAQSQASGDIWIGTGMYAGYELAGATTRYTDFIVHALP